MFCSFRSDTNERREANTLPKRGPYNHLWIEELRGIAARYVEAVYGEITAVKKKLHARGDLSWAEESRASRWPRSPLLAFGVASTLHLVSSQCSMSARSRALVCTALDDPQEACRPRGSDSI